MTAFTRLLEALGPLGIGLWVLVFLVVLGCGGFALWLERREWRARGQGEAWRAMRLALLPITVLSLLAAWLAMPHVAGMEGLAVGYLFLLVVAPALYFALHLLLGRLLSPPLPKAQAMILAVTGLVGLVAVPLAINAAAPPIRELTRAAAAALRDAAAEAPGRHGIASRQRFVADAVGEFWTFHLSAPAGVRIEDARLLPPDAVPVDIATTQSPWACRADEDLHLLLPAAATPTLLEIVWSDGGLPKRSRWTLTAPPQAARRFEPAWPDDGIALPVRLPKTALDIGFAGSGGQIAWNGAAGMTGQAGESLGDFGCMKTPYRYPRPVVAVRLRLDPPGRVGPLRQVVFPRPDGTPAAPGGEPGTEHR